jgi:sec-independent protein translocase protein TatA
MNISKELIIILVVALLIFGPSRLAGLGAALGKTVRDFRKSMDEPEEPKPTSTAQGSNGPTKP